MAEAKENHTAGDNILSSDDNLRSVNANDAGGFRDDLNAGETLAGATTPVAVYQNKTDEELYACDANDTDKLKFIGFVISSADDGEAIDFQGSGVVRGFTGLTVGEKYYVQDDKTIGTSPGTYEVLVGVAITATDILITKGRRRASGIVTFSATATSAIACGFRPSLIKVTAVTGQQASGYPFSHGGWSVFGGNNCVFQTGNVAGSFSSSSYAWYTEITTNNIMRGTVTTIIDTGFTLDNTKVNSGVNTYIYWEAEGDL